ncbi:MAG TPA: NlpC/P60 family protein [Hellea balneolensis]|uniref:NlpC/P60 family protein n=1 Tax=Hellea balneolensis TaxID=287478 RepID=A0A7C5LZI4_9PROT|nr:NlpC/P60 family protein [Hellea balneolensis]
MDKLDPRITPFKDGFAADHLKDKVDAKVYGAPIRQQIIMPVVPLHQRPATTSMMDTQLLLGTEFDMYDIAGSWAWGQEVTPAGFGYVGYVPKMTLAPPAFTPSHRVCVLRAPVFAKPDLKSPIRLDLPLNAKFLVEDTDGDYLKATGFGYIHKNHICQQTDKDTDFVQFAELHLGLPYVWGGISSDGVDCSGLVQSALRAAGQDAPRDSDLQQKYLGHEVKDYKQLRRGDLVFWLGHVGIMRDEKTLLHANAYHMTVASEPLEKATERISLSAGSILSIKRL